MNEMENLRMQLRDRDFEIIDLTFKLKTANEAIFKMRNCENCKNAGFDGETYSCEKNDEVCSLPELESWEPKE